jgi:hypothetical protein
MKQKVKVVEIDDYLATAVKNMKKGHILTIVRDNNPNLILKLKYNDKKNKKEQKRTI